MDGGFRWRFLQVADMREFRFEDRFSKQIFSAVFFFFNERLPISLILSAAECPPTATEESPQDLVRAQHMNKT